MAKRKAPVIPLPTGTAADIYGALGSAFEASGDDEVTGVLCFTFRRNAPYSVYACGEIFRSDMAIASVELTGAVIEMGIPDDDD